MKESIEAKIGQMLREKGLLLAVAESCTGGLISHRITSVAGSSDYFSGGVVAYANEVKVAILGVREMSLAENGAASTPVAKEMAEGVLRKLNADIAVATTGIAGPGGGTAEKPVGLVFIGLATEGESEVRPFKFEGDRMSVQKAASDAALEMIYNSLLNKGD